MPRREMFPCFICKHLRSERKCIAFPQGIPDEIYFLGFDHRNEFPGDNGVRFEIAQSCECCENYIGNNKCLAFPRGIPEVILRGEFDHRNEFPGDNGVRFKPRRSLLRAVFRAARTTYTYYKSLPDEEGKRFLQELKESLLV